MVAVIDHALGRPMQTDGVIVDELTGTRHPYVDEVGPALTPEQVALLVCPKCGCGRSIHGAGGSKERCERHPGCRWPA